MWAFATFFLILVSKKSAQNGTLFGKIAYLCSDMLRKACKTVQNLQAKNVKKSHFLCAYNYKFYDNEITMDELAESPNMICSVGI